MKYKVIYDITHIDNTDNWTQLYAKVLYESENAKDINKVVNKLHKQYGGEIEHLNDSEFESILLHVQNLPNDERIETSISVWSRVSFPNW